jgi:hypothetical protein
LRAAPGPIFPVPGFPIMKLLISSGADPKGTVDDSLEQISLMEFINKALKRCYPEEASAVLSQLKSMHPTSATTSLCERRPGRVQETPDVNEAVPDLLDDDISEELLLGESYGYYKLKISST